MAQLDTTSEREQVKSARDGDVEAVGRLYESYSDRIYSYVYVRLGDHAESEDVTGQVFLKMVEKIGEFQWQGAGFAAWLFRIAHNQVIDSLRKRARHNHVPMDQAGLTLPNSHADRADPQRHAERVEFLAHIRDALLNLSDLQAQVITLKYAAELSNAEIADVMSRTPNAVNSLHYEAIKKLEKLLAQKGYTHG